MVREIGAKARAACPRWQAWAPPLSLRPGPTGSTGVGLDCLVGSRRSRQARSAARQDVTRYSGPRRQPDFECATCSTLEYANIQALSQMWRPIASLLSYLPSSQGLCRIVHRSKGGSKRCWSSPACSGPASLALAGLRRQRRALRHRIRWQTLVLLCAAASSRALVVTAPGPRLSTSLSDAVGPPPSRRSRYFSQPNTAVNTAPPPRPFSPQLRPAR